MPQPDQKERPKPCQEMNRSISGTKTPCNRPGVWCWVYGEYGRLAKRLCNPHIQYLRSIGWKVQYQLLGDDPEPQSGQATIGGNDA